MDTVSEKIKNRDKKFREKLKEDPVKLQAYRLKAKERAQTYRQRQLKLCKTSKKLTKERREKDRVRQKQHRMKNKNSKFEETNEAYTCKQTLGKAVKKVEKAMPMNLKKKIAVLNVLNAKYLNSTIIAEKKSSKSLEHEQKIKTVKDFYMREDISVQAAGRKETLVIDGQIVAKRFMLMTVLEAFELFKNEYDEEYVSKSTFFQNRPREIELTSKTPHNMCVCQHHANFRFLLEGCAKVLKSFSTNFQSFLQTACCNIETEKCMTSECENCVQDVQHDLIPVKDLKKLEETVKWQHWRKVQDRVTLTQTIAPLSDLIHELEAQLPLFKVHFFVKRAQQQYFEMKKNTIKPGELILQVDFAENYRLMCQNEVQSAHFSYQQSTIFTCVAWLAGDTKSFAIISDKLTHNKYDVYCFITTLVQQIKNQYGHFQNIFIFSDGSSSQFKNKFIGRSLPNFLVEFGCKYIEWNFFATSHGKGAVDGVGAVIKRKVWQITKAKNIILHDALALFECARDHINGIHLTFISADEIERLSPPLTKKWKEVPSISGMHKLHYLSCEEDLQIKVARTAISSKRNI